MKPTKQQQLEVLYEWVEYMELSPDETQQFINHINKSTLNLNKIKPQDVKELWFYAINDMNLGCGDYGADLEGLDELIEDVLTGTLLKTT